MDTCTLSSALQLYYVDAFPFTDEEGTDWQSRDENSCQHESCNTGFPSSSKLAKV